MSDNGGLFSIIAFFLVWIVILVPFSLTINKISKKNKRKENNSKVPTNLKPSNNKYKTLFIRCYKPDGLDANSQKASQIKLQICQNLYSATGKVSVIRLKPNTNEIDTVTIRVGDTSVKLPENTLKTAEADEKIIVFYEKGLSGIFHYVTAIKASELEKITFNNKSLGPEIKSDK